jgi:surface antigen
LNGDALAAGTSLKIPPINGIVYIVQAGDTPDSLADRFHSNRDKIIAYNDAEIHGLHVGQQIIIPDAVKIAASVARRSSEAPNSFAWGGSTPVYGSNGYDWGYCTWYVASQISVPSNWGNANTWAYYAVRSGWKVSSTPTPGAIAQTPAGGLGHVAIVNEVSEDGTQIRYRDMNGIAGFAHVGYSGWVSASKFPNYLTH